MKEALPKEVRQAFGLLQARFEIVAQPARGWNKEKLRCIMNNFIILHNMIVEDERGLPEDFEYKDSKTVVKHAQTDPVNFSINNCISLCDSKAHHKLKNDLIKHLWSMKGRSE